MKSNKVFYVVIVLVGLIAIGCSAFGEAELSEERQAQIAAAVKADIDRAGSNPPVGLTAEEAAQINTVTNEQQLAEGVVNYQHDGKLFYAPTNAIVAYVSKDGIVWAGNATLGYVYCERVESGSGRYEDAGDPGGAVYWNNEQLKVYDEVRSACSQVPQIVVEPHDFNGAINGVRIHESFYECSSLMSSKATVAIGSAPRKKAQEICGGVW